MIFLAGDQYTVNGENKTGRFAARAPVAVTGTGGLMVTSNHRNPRHGSKTRYIQVDDLPPRPLEYKKRLIVKLRPGRTVRIFTKDGSE